MSFYETHVKPREVAGKTDAEIIAELNAKTIPKQNEKLMTGVEVKDALGSATAAGQALNVLKGIANGTGNLPTGMAEEVRGVVEMELAQLSGAGLNLANQGTNDFLRQAGLDNVADLGKWQESIWEDSEGRGVVMTQADLESVRTTHAHDELINWAHEAHRAMVDAIDAGETDKSTLRSLIEVS